MHDTKVLVLPSARVNKRTRALTRDLCDLPIEAVDCALRDSFELARGDDGRFDRNGRCRIDRESNG